MQRTDPLGRWHRGRRRLRAGRGGLLLDAVLAVVVLALIAFVLSLAGVTLSEIVEGVGHFLGG